MPCLFLFNSTMQKEIDKLKILPCKEGDLAEVLGLEAIVLAHLERPDLLRRNTEAMWQACLQSPHVCLGAWSGEALVGVAVLYVPTENDREALAPLLQTVDAAGYRAAHFKICFVHPDWRGHHLQVLLGQQLHTKAQQRGYDLLCATASPHNIPSIKSLQQLGYQADHVTRKYGSERIIFYCFN